MYFYNSPYLPRSELCSTFVKSFFLYGAEAPCYICVNIFVGRVFRPVFLWSRRAVVRVFRPVFRYILFVHKNTYPFIV